MVDKVRINVGVRVSIHERRFFPRRVASGCIPQIYDLPMAESSNRRRTSSLSPIEATHPQSGRTASERSKGWKRRTAKACDACRKRKIKCDGVRPKCSRCSLNGFNCIYADFEKEEPARRSRG
ncbi:hypothetical protein BDV97DRAFT_111061 [Delphinella strobiligena]|nr:hypothetical protein BDV97DRAFT_111061 [Delphinella strobiligena]